MVAPARVGIGGIRLPVDTRRERWTRCEPRCVVECKAALTTASCDVSWWWMTTAMLQDTRWPAEAVGS